MRILHIVESFGGGTASAVLAYVAATPELEHCLIYGTRPESGPMVDAVARFAVARPMPSGPVAARRAVRQAVRELDVQVVHAHSSWAGAIARVSLSKAQIALVYTPHCFAFERRDVPAVFRFAFRLIEGLLAMNTTLVAACSARESDLASALKRDLPTVVVPNVAQGRSMQVTADDENEIRAPRVVTVGRLAQQKDPGLFEEVASLVQARLPSATFRWIGASADDKLVGKLAFDITGWMGPDDVRSELEEADLYLHTAAWEGFPISILEAHEAGLPIVARRISALEPLAEIAGADSAARLAALCVDVLSVPTVRQSNRQSWRDRLAENTQTIQSERLRTAYKRALELTEASS